MEYDYKKVPDYHKDIKPRLTEIVNEELTKTSKKEILKYLEDCRINLKKLEEEGEDIGNIFFQRIDEFKQIVQEDLHIDNPMQYQRIKAQLELFSILKESGVKHKDYDTILQSFYLLIEELKELNIFYEKKN